MKKGFFQNLRDKALDITAEAKVQLEELQAEGETLPDRIEAELNRLASDLDARVSQRRKKKQQAPLIEIIPPDDRRRR